MYIELSLLAIAVFFSILSFMLIFCNIWRPQNKYKDTLIDKISKTILSICASIPMVLLMLLYVLTTFNFYKGV